MKLNELCDNDGARKSIMRVGRGIGSGKGKTAGRGVKGQKSRTGVSINGFEGGQTPLHMRLPKFGFTNINRKKYAVINLKTLQTAIDNGDIEAGQAITVSSLAEAGVIRREHAGIRVLNNGTLTAKIDITVAGISETAKAAIEKAGGSVNVIEIKPREMSIKQAEKSKAKKASAKK